LVRALGGRHWSPCSQRTLGPGRLRTISRSSR
jgi:hypothetical protein